MNSATAFAAIEPDETDRTEYGQIKRQVERMINLEPISMDEYMQLYADVHSFCTRGPRAINGGRRSAHLRGQPLYMLFIEILGKHLRKIKDKSKELSDEALLEFYINEWKRYLAAGKFLSHAFRYLDRHWIQRELDEGKKNTYKIGTLVLVQWKATVFDAMHDNALEVVLRLTEKQRRGEFADTSKAKGFIDSFITLSLDDEDENEATSSLNLKLYRERFEKPFKNATLDFYRGASTEFLLEHSFSEYMEQVEKWILMEEDRVPLYLLNEIMGTLIQACEEALIIEHLDTFYDNFEKMLDKGYHDDIQRLYRLLHRVKGGIGPLRRKFESYVVDSGMSSLAQLSGGSDEVDYVAYTNMLFHLIDKYETFFVEDLSSDPELRVPLEAGCRQFVNHNIFCGEETAKSPELLATFLDSAFRKGCLGGDEEAAREEKLQQIIKIYGYIEDKDVFQKFYGRLLARRLVQENSVSEDVERNMLGRLKGACGFRHTYRLQQMLRDVELSRDLTATYASWRKPGDGETPGQKLTVSMQILGAGSWPLKPCPTDFSPPQMIATEATQISAFYGSQHQKRRLAWLWHLSKGEMQARHVMYNGKVPYTFRVSIFQMAVLLLFNDEELLAYETIQQKTKLNEKILGHTLGSLVKAQVLVPDQAQAKPCHGTKYSLNMKFKAKRQKVNLNLSAKSDKMALSADVHKAITEDRKLLTQAAIVRIMKSRKKMHQRDLMLETQMQLMAQFTPSEADVSRCIELLRNKEFLERLEDDHIGYLA